MELEKCQKQKMSRLCLHVRKKNFHSNKCDLPDTIMFKKTNAGTLDQLTKNIFNE